MLIAGEAVTAIHDDRQADTYMIFIKDFQLCLFESDNWPHIHKQDSSYTSIYPGRMPEFESADFPRIYINAGHRWAGEFTSISVGNLASTSFMKRRSKSMSIAMFSEMSGRCTLTATSSPVDRSWPL